MSATVTSPSTRRDEPVASTTAHLTYEAATSHGRHRRPPRVTGPEPGGLQQARLKPHTVPRHSCRWGEHCASSAGTRPRGPAGWCRACRLLSAQHTRPGCCGPRAVREPFTRPSETHSRGQLPSPRSGPDQLPTRSAGRSRLRRQQPTHLAWPEGSRQSREASSQRKRGWPPPTARSK